MENWRDVALEEDSRCSPASQRSDGINQTQFRDEDDQIERFTDLGCWSRWAVIYEKIDAPLEGIFQGDNDGLRVCVYVWIWKREREGGWRRKEEPGRRGCGRVHKIVRVTI